MGLSRVLKHPAVLLAGAALLGTAVLGGGLWYKLHHAEPIIAETASQVTTPDNPLFNQPRPDFALAELDGTIRAVKEWDGKVIAVNFWATWCPPCKREIPSFNALQRELGPAGMQFVGVAVDDRGAVESYTKDTIIDYPVLVGDEAKTIAVAEQYGNATGILPYTVIIDRKGRIAYVQYGELPEELAREVIKSLL